MTILSRHSCKGIFMWSVSRPFYPKKGFSFPTFIRKEESPSKNFKHLRLNHPHSSIARVIIPSCQVNLYIRNRHIIMVVGLEQRICPFIGFHIVYHSKRTKSNQRRISAKNSQPFSSNTSFRNSSGTVVVVSTGLDG